MESFASESYKYKCEPSASSIGLLGQGVPTAFILSRVVWRSSRIESVSFLYVNESSVEAVAVSADSEESTEALSELASAFASLLVSPDVFDSESVLTSATEAASEDEVSVEAAPHPIRASIIVAASKIAVVVFFFIVIVLPIY